MLRFDELCDDFYYLCSRGGYDEMPCAKTIFWLLSTEQFCFETIINT